MGISFSEPVTVKRSLKVMSESMMCGSSTMQGWRMKMEDAHTHLLTIADFPGLSYFALFDGHGGADVANFANNKLIKRFLAEIFANKNKIGYEDYPAALTDAFMRLDDEIAGLGQGMIGSTANVFIIVENDIYCANIGDSRLVISVGGMAFDMSEDHKPNNEEELMRIVEAGGWVQNYRVNGTLALSRALGDFFYKGNKGLAPDKQMVIAVPDITKTTITADYEFFVQACDGIWDVMTSQEVVNFVRLRVANRMNVDVICEELMTNCLAPDLHMAGLGCDNMTVIVGLFLNGMTKESHCKTCQSFVPFQLNPVLPKATKITDNNNETMLQRITNSTFNKFARNIFKKNMVSSNNNDGRGDDDVVCDNEDVGDDDGGGDDESDVESDIRSDEDGHDFEKDNRGCSDTNKNCLINV